MKPDQHKKKRSAQYKKKHGMAKDGTKEAKKETAKRDRTGRPTIGSVAVKSTDREGTAAKAIHQKTGTESWSSSDEGVCSEHQSDMYSGRSFKRREIASNWEKYDGVNISDSEEEELRGADFKTLLEATSNAMSQFRFQEEKDWIVDDSSMCDVLTLNPDDIAAALECVPLHQRLDIEKEVFDEKDVHRYEEIAAMNSRVYKPIYKGDISQAASVQTDCVTTSLQNKLIDSFKDEKQEHSDSSGESDDILSDILDLKETVSGSGKEKENMAVQNTDREKNSLMEQIWDKESDILDDLLTMTTTQPALGTSEAAKKNIQDKNIDKQFVSTSDLKQDKESHTKKSLASAGNSHEQSLISQRQMTHIEDELDQLLALDDYPSSDNKVLPTKTDEAKSDNLDDWLDSVLGD